MPQRVPFFYWIVFGPIVAVGTFSLLLLGLGRTGQRPADAAWKGSFYSNPNDPALLVPKRFGIGYTLNFGNPWSWAVLAFVLLMVAVPFILLVDGSGNQRPGARAIRRRFSADGANSTGTVKIPGRADSSAFGQLGVYSGGPHPIELLVP
jgi:Family of unknown function (DUF5808)